MTRPSNGCRLACLGAALVFSPPAPGAQTEAPRSLLGRWAGSAKLTNEWGTTPCAYSGGGTPAVAETPPAVTLELRASGERVEATATLELPGTPGSPCPPVRKRYAIPDVRVSDSTVSFRDPAGHEWNLALRGERLQGLLHWSAGPDEPLAEGFTGPAGEKPLTRLSGEVNLGRVAGDAGPAAEPVAEAKTGAKPDVPPGEGKEAKRGGEGLGLLPSLIGANAVGLGAFYGVMKLTDDSGSASTGSATCSPRNCLFSGVVDPCVCNLESITSGTSCATTAGGVAFGGSCSLPARPCQAGLSCNNGICDEKFGRCPF
jgi:hypothetical protein